MKIPFTLKQLIWLLIAVVVGAVMLSVFVQAIIEYSKTGEDWASSLIQSLGNILGGIIGGIVAIIVAAYQINRTQLADSRKQSLVSLTMLKLIREELRDNINLVESSMPYRIENYKILKTQLSDDIWKSAMINLTISDQLLVKLNVAYKKIILLRHFEEQEINDQILTSTKDQLNGILESLKIEIADIDLKLGNKTKLETD